MNKAYLDQAGNTDQAPAFRHHGDPTIHDVPWCAGAFKGPLIPEGHESLGQLYDCQKKICWDEQRLSQPVNFVLEKADQVRASRHHGGRNSTIVPWCSGGSREALDWAPIVLRNASLSGSCTPDRCSFSSLLSRKMFPQNNSAVVFEIRTEKKAAALEDFFFVRKMWLFSYSLQL